MHSIDWFIVLIYATSTIVLGWYFGRRQNSTKEYFVGSGKMNPLLVGVSLFATLLSTISYLAIPGETLAKGPVYLANLLVYPLVFLVIGYVILPVYMRQRVTSAYELLEDRLGPDIRMLGVALFLLLRLVWMAVLVSMTADALQAVMGVGKEWAPLIAIVTGAFAITYASVGGMRAVVTTDLMQTLLLYGGALLVLVTITVKMNGFSWFPTEWQDDIWDEQPFFSTDLSVRVTVVGSLLTSFLWMVCTAMGDQVTIQRFMSTEDATAARKAVAMQLTVGVVVGITLGLVGVALLGYYKAHPNQLPNGKTIADYGDKAFSWFIANQLPPVISGLVVSGLFAAAMSSVDSGVNSITAVVQTDILPRIGKAPQTEAARMKFARQLAVLIGIVVVLLSFLRKAVPGNFMKVTQTTVNLLTVPISLLFVFALFVPFANRRGVWVATCASITAAVLVAFNGPIFGYQDPDASLPHISFQWIPVAALIAGLGCGLLACLIFRGPKEDRLDKTRPAGSPPANQTDN